MAKKYKALRIFLLIIGALLLILTAGILFLYSNKDDYAKMLILEVNSRTKGELQIQDVEFNPFVHFPNISLSLKQPVYFESKIGEMDSLPQPIFQFAEVHLSFDIIKLMQSEIDLTEVSLEKGQVYLRQNKEGKFNIELALQEEHTLTSQQRKLSKKPSSTAKSTDSLASDGSIVSAEDTLKHKTNQPKQTTEDVQTEVEQALSLSIEELRLDSIDVVIDLQPSGLKQVFTIVETEADINYVKDSIHCRMSSYFDIERLDLDKDIDIEDEELGLEIDFLFDRNDEIILVNQSDLEFRNAHFYAKGKIDLNDQGYVELSFEAADDKLQFTRLFFTSEGIDNLKSGSLFLRGKAEGAFRGQIPSISCEFGAKDMNVEIPKTGDHIRELEIDGHFYSGTLEDFSQAVLKLDTVHAILPTGYVRASSVLENLRSPIIQYDLDAAFRLDNLGKIFDLGPIDSLKGGIRIIDEYRGLVSSDSLTKDQSEELFNLKLDSVSFVIRDILDIDLLEGSITGHIDSVNLDTLKIRSGESDLLVNGVLRKLSHMIHDTDTLIEAELQVRSDLFDFPVLFKVLPNTSESFPYVIRDIWIDISVETSMEKLDNFWKVPEMNFKIREAAASVDSLIDYVKLRDGTFDMFEKDSAFFLDFKDFNLLADGTTSKAAFQFIEQKGKRDSMNFALRTDGINPSQLLYMENDSVPDFTDAWLSGDYRGTIVLPYEEESTKLIHRANLAVEDFYYRAEDTISAGIFEYRTENISYEGETTKSILATLDAENDFYFRDLVTPIFQSDSLGLFVNIKNGVIKISPHDHQTLGEGETGTIRLYPNEEPPKFELDYTIKNLPLEDFLGAFNSEELLRGTVDIKLDLKANGLDLEKITSSLSGYIYVVGDSLMLQGLNLDDVIKDFQRSQSFNLVDIGAVVLTGPAGIVYSKGSSYVSLLTADKNDSTQIGKFSSKWNLDLGKITVDDVAFATLKNRVAAKGWMDMKTDSLDIAIGVLNEKGCAIFDQRIYGSAENPEYSKVKFLKTLLAPVTNVVKGALGVKCEVFYDGIVAHPEKPEKEKK